MMKNWFHAVDKETIMPRYPSDLAENIVGMVLTSCVAFPGDIENSHAFECANRWWH
jgi:hypothetical protein